jgi:hypothetical protein
VGSDRHRTATPLLPLQNKLAQRCPLVVGSEYRSTKTSCCHHCPVTEVTWEHNDRRCTIVKCQACRGLLSRDRNAAHVIADIFLAVCGTTYSETEPLWVRDDAVRESNKLNTTPPSWWCVFSWKNITVTSCLSTKKQHQFWCKSELIFCCLNPRFNCMQGTVSVSNDDTAESGSAPSWLGKLQNVCREFTTVRVISQRKDGCQLECCKGVSRFGFC